MLETQANTREITSKVIVEVARQRKMLPSPAEVVVSDDDHEEIVRPESVGFGHAEGQSFMIEYKNAKGIQSRRRITVWNVTPGSGGAPCLYARCHETGSMRSFRVDRISCVIDYDGVVHDDVPTFMTEYLGIASLIASRTQDDLARERWSEMLRVIRPYAVLLSGLSLSDGVTRDVEIQAAIGFLSRHAYRAGFDLDDAECMALHRYLRNIRPDEEMLIDAVDALLGLNPEETVRFLAAGKAVIDADGILHPEEVAMLNELAVQLTGVALA